MKCIIGIILGLLIGFATPAFSENAPKSEFKPAKDFKLMVLGTRKLMTLEQFKGAPLVLEWSNPDCPFVQKHYDSDNMQKLQKKYTALGIKWGIVFSGKTAKIKEKLLKNYYRRDKKIAKDVLLLTDESGDAGHDYGAKTTPHLFVIDAKSNLVYFGAIDDHRSADDNGFDKAKNFVAPVLDDLIAGKTPTQEPQAPYGCSVKY
ncbi:MAG: redoxin family protein [Xanthomonadaceae bacterium]|nr:redoxin family protein [Xanthomonadaceae bacterium]